MIGIWQNIELTDEYMKKTVDAYWSRINKIKKFDENKKLADLKNELLAIDQSYSFEYIIKADYEELVNINNILKNNGFVEKKKIFVKWYDNTLRADFGKWLIEELKVTVCPYCNRNFINSGKNKSMAQFDHYLNKNDYPIFALSFYNLIPCCQSCNHTKGNNPLGLSPYDKKNSTDNIIEFDYIPSSLSENEIIIIAKNKNMKTNINLLDLEVRYKIHIDLLSELIFKIKSYPKDYIEALQNGMPDYINMNAKELYYSNYLEEGFYYKRPLSKFTHDMINKIEEFNKKGT